MMKKSIYLKRYSLIALIAMFFSCSTNIDINNEQAVLKDIQGVWIGCAYSGNLYRHIKLNVANDLFEAWIQTSESKDVPSWAKIPDESGAISLSSVLKDSERNLKFRKFALTCSGRCCGDKSFSINELSKLITYDDGKGLTLAGKVKMTKK